jgi:serine/threonine-protein kinase
VTIPAADGSPALEAPGRLVAGRYRLSRVIATGGMGQVWRGFDQHSERPVAVKVLRPEYASDPAFAERFRTEARTAAMLDHPNIAVVVDYGEQTGPHGEPTGAYLVMELVVGEPLSAIVRREGALPVARTLHLLAQAAAGLQAAHDAGVVHRDVKPANLLVTDDEVVKITDFGIARAAGALSLTRTGMVLGTAHYLSPEQVQGRSASPASDQYALGVVAFECLTGHRPFQADSALEVALAHQRDPVPALPSSVPRPVAALVRRALAKDPTARHPSAGALGSVAAGLLAAPAQPTSRASTPSTPSRRTPVPPRAAVPPSARRSVRLPPIALGLLLVAALIAALVSSHRHHHPTPAPRPPVTADISVQPQTYAGAPVAQVVAALRADGLVPAVQQVSASGTPGTVVTIVASDGAPLPASLSRGTAVVVQVVS